VGRSPSREAVSLFRGDIQLGFDPAAAIAHLRAADPRLGELIDRVGPCLLKVNEIYSPLEGLAEAVVYQQLAGNAARAIFGRFRSLFSAGPFPSPKQVLDIPEAALRSAGLSRAKIAAIRDLASKTLDGTIPPLAQLLTMTDEEIVSRLTEVRGVGRWTVEMLLIFRLGRPDVLPAHDYGLRKGFALAFGSRKLPSPAQVERRGKRWQPYRTCASWYLWRAAELPPGTLSRRARGRPPAASPARQ
jgi:3-methyladenine DNA glycosylase/8-oxoguanine DNA glycosylase